MITSDKYDQLINSVILILIFVFRVVALWMTNTMAENLRET